jgi:hypothetical protein
VSELTEHCRGHWKSIFMQLGLLDAKTLAGRHVPCPMCGGRDRFHFSDRDGVGLWHCRSCGGGDGFKLIMEIKGVDFPRAAKLVESVVGRARWNRSWRRRRSQPEREEPQPTQGKTTTADAIQLWRATVDFRETPGEVYLRSRKLIVPDEMVNQEGASLRWHAGIGALVALFRNIHTNAPQAVSRIFVDANGRKLKRMFLGPVDSAAIKLDRDADVTTALHIGEGFETCQAARQKGLRPTWALGTAGAIERFPVLSGVETLSVLGEKGCTENERAIQACGCRWQDVGREVEIIYPDIGKDMNDLLMEQVS